MSYVNNQLYNGILIDCITNHILGNFSIKARVKSKKKMSVYKLFVKSRFAIQHLVAMVTLPMPMITKAAAPLRIPNLTVSKATL